MSKPCIFSEKFLAPDTSPRIFKATETLEQYLQRGGSITKGPSHKSVYLQHTAKQSLASLHKQFKKSEGYL